MTEIKNLTIENSILAINDGKVAVGGIISSNGASTVNGRQIISAGTIVGGPNNFLNDDNAVLNIANDSTAQGVLEHDVDVTDGNASGTVIIEGYLNPKKMPSVPTSDADKALTKITFMNR